MTTDLISPPTTPANPIALLATMDLKAMDPDKMGQLLDLQAKWEDREAKKAFFVALSEFQSRAPIIEKGDDANGKKYAKMDRIWRTIKPLFTELGLSCTWQTCDVRDGMVRVEGQLAHNQGHSIPLSMDVALPELIRGQNAAQQVGSARTYATRYAFCAAVGLQTGEDDDADSVVATITAIQAKEISDKLDTLLDRESAMVGMLDFAQVETIEQIPAARFIPIIKALKTKPAK